MALDPPPGWSQNNLAAETSARYRHSAALQSQQSASVARSGSYRYVFKMSLKNTPDATVNRRPEQNIPKFFALKSSYH